MSHAVLERNQVSILPEITWSADWIQQQLRYRVAMPVMELLVFPRAFGETSYYKCPRCQVTMEREFQSFCDRCGQKLDWDDYLNVKIIRR